MIEIVTTLSTNLFRTFIIKRFMSVFFETEIDDKKKEMLVYFSFFSLSALIYLLFHFPPANIFTNLFLIYWITQLYIGKQKKKILITFLIYGINMICDIISMYSCNDYMVGKEYNEVSAYITVFLIGICEFIIERFLVKNRKENFIFPYWKILITIPILSIIVLLILIMNNLNNQVILVSVSVGILFINLLIFYLYDVLMEAYLKLEESSIFERQIASYSNQLSIMMQSEEKVRALRHDMKHHLNELSIMANRSNAYELKSYIQNMNIYFNNPCEYVSSANKEVDSLVNYMLNKAKHVLEKVDYKISIPNEFQIPVFDLNIIMGNLLDNAIAASELSEQRWLEFTLRYEQGMVFVRIRNSYDNNLKKRGDTYATTKKESHEHGIGLTNVKKVVDKYNGDIKIVSENNIFDVKIILYTLALK